jgi:hypothetical protein
MSRMFEVNCDQDVCMFDGLRSLYDTGYSVPVSTFFGRVFIQKAIVDN